MASFGGSAWTIHCFMWGDLLNRAVAAIHTFRVYMEQIVFDISYLLRLATFSEDLSYAFDFLRAVYLFSHSISSQPSLEVVHLFFFLFFVCFFYGRHHSFEVHSVVFIHYTTCCHSFSFVVTRCHFFSLIASRCHSLSIVVTRCTTRCHSLSLDVPLVCPLKNKVLLCRKTLESARIRLWSRGPRTDIWGWGPRKTNTPFFT